MTTKILVFGCDDKSGLAVVRSLGRAGYEVHTAWPSNRSVVNNSRYVTGQHKILHHTTGAAWVADLVKTVTDNAIDLILPCNDLAMVGIYINKVELSRATKVYAINQRAFEVCFNKAQTTKLARSVGVSVPDEIEVTDPSHIRFPPEWGFPVIIKPASSVDLVRPGERRLVSKVYDFAALKDSATIALEGGPILLQRNFFGRGAGWRCLHARDAF